MSDERQKVPLWNNWCERTQKPDLEVPIDEHEIYSDVEAIDGVGSRFGPYEVISLVPEPCHHETCRPVLALRVGFCVSRNTVALQDDFTALMSLAMGVRLQAGDATHCYVSGEGWHPRAQHIVRRPYRPVGSVTRIIPRGGHAALADLELLKSFPALVGNHAAALVRAARAYQTALWVSEREPWLSWLRLVSAAEAIAKVWVNATSGDDDPRQDAVEWLQKNHPEAVSVLSQFELICLCICMCLSMWCAARS